ncbi:hypothetical protein JCM8547_003251 [Rhodosporidiobolus lusitaniae]
MATSATHPYSCLTCQLMYQTALEQREHYASELHRYNSRRKVAGLPPLTQEHFDDKVKERTIQTGAPGEQKEEQGQQKRLACKACKSFYGAASRALQLPLSLEDEDDANRHFPSAFLSKTFGSAATHDAHIKTKKHKDNVFKAASAVKVADLTPEPSEPIPSTSTAPPPPPVAPVEAADDARFESSGDAALDRLVAKRLQYAPPIAPSSCLFCIHSSSDVASNVAHMRSAHSFVIPEEEYLVDLEGLLRRLGEEVGTWCVCVCCGKGYGGNIDLNKEQEFSQEELRKRASKGVEAVRAHMQSKSHCRIPYDTEDEQLNIADFYDFRPSYPDYAERQAKKAAKRAAKAAEKAAKTGAADGWEDVDGEEDAEMAEGEDVEVVYELAGSDEDDSDSDSDDDDLDVPTGTSVTYGDTEYELVLPSGGRIGHRAHRTLHKQNHLPYLDGTPFKPTAHSSPREANAPSAHSQALLALVPSLKPDQSKKDRAFARSKLADQALIPAKGAGFGGKSQNEVMKARNAGEAREAGKVQKLHTASRKFHDRQLAFGIKGNNQKHFRDFLLQ